MWCSEVQHRVLSNCPAAGAEVEAAKDSSAEQIEVRELVETDTAALQNLFQQIFDKPMSEAFWQWKYRSHPAHSIGALRDGLLQAHYGAIGLDACFFGNPARVVQIVDVMVRPAARQGVRNRSLFFRTCTHFVDQYVGHGRTYLFGFGFPSERAMNLAARLGVYAPVGQMKEISWDISGRGGKAGWLTKMTPVTLDSFDSMRNSLEELWEQQAQDLREHVVIRKNADWINWRYLQNPDVQYKLWLLRSRFSRKPAGLIVLKAEAERMLLMDCIGPLQNIPTLVQQAIAKSREAGKHKLVTWISAAFENHFLVQGGKAERLPIIIPANIWSEGPKPDELRDHWWLMPGDTDFL